MKTLFGKRQVMMATLVAALGLAIYLNYYFSTQDPVLSADTSPVSTTTAATTQRNLGDSQYVAGTTATTQPTQVTYFAQARINRAAAREEALDIINDTMNDAKATAEMKTKAADAALYISKAVEQEDKIESLLKAKGFADSVVFIEDKECFVVVLADGITPQETLQITEVIVSQSSVTADKIKIITMKS